MNYELCIVNYELLIVNYEKDIYLAIALARCDGHVHGMS